MQLMRIIFPFRVIAALLHKIKHFCVSYLAASIKHNMQHHGTSNKLLTLIIQAECIDQRNKQSLLVSNPHKYNIEKQSHEFESGPLLVTTCCFKTATNK